MNERVVAAATGAWKWISETAAPAVVSAYAKHETVRHLVTLAVGAFLGGVFL